MKELIQFLHLRIGRLGVLVLLGAFFCPMFLSAQLLNDGSFEGNQDHLPTFEGWSECEGSPDSQILDGFGVGIFGINTPASHGNQYLGLLAESGAPAEAVGQAVELVGGQLYSGSIDLFRSVVHHNWNGTGQIEIWAGFGCGAEQELLWSSGSILNEDVWQTYPVNLLPVHSYSWLTIKAVLDNGSGDMTYVCLDNFSLLSSALGFNFLNFDAESIENGIRFNWETAALEDLIQFQIEASLDGSQFESVGNISGSEGQKTFSYDFIGAHEMRYYRIKAQDQNGNIFLSNIIEFASSNVVLAKLSPNPAHDFVRIEMPRKAEASYQIRLLNLSGQLICDPIFTNGSYELSIPSKIESGLYILEILEANKISYQRLVIR